MVNKIEWKALSSRVLIVACMGEAEDWAAYIDAVKGQCHDVEWYDVADYGCKVPREVAELYFPGWKHLAYRD